MEILEKIIGCHPISWEYVYDQHFTSESLKWSRQYGLEEGLEEMERAMKKYKERRNWYEGDMKIEDLLDVAIHKKAYPFKQIACKHHQNPCEECCDAVITFGDLAKYGHQNMNEGWDGELKLKELGQFVQKGLLFRPRLILSEEEEGFVMVQEGNSRLCSLVLFKGVQGYNLPVYYGEIKK